MSDQLLNAFEQLITPSRIEKLKEIFGDEPDQINSTLTAGLPVVLNGIMSKCGTVDGTGKIMHAAHELHNKNILGNLDDLFTGGGELSHVGGKLAGEIFGGGEHAISQKIAETTGAKTSTTLHILGIVTPVVLALLGKEVTENKMDNKGFIHYLLSKVSAFSSLAPASLSAASLGLPGTDTIKHKLDAVAYTLSGAQPVAHATHAHAPVHAENTEKKGVDAVLLTVFLLVLGLLAWWLLGSTKPEVVAEEPVASESMPTIKKAVIDTVARTITLPNDYLFHVSKGTMEYKLVEFLNDASRPAGKDVWFDFDDVNFDEGKSDITQSNLQLENIADILKAYPKTKVKIGGYTDSTGHEEINLKLSQTRAEAVSAALNKRGITSEQLLGAEGYGSKFAKVSAKAPANERRIDRRMSLSVREK